MKKLIVMALVLFATTVQAATLSFDAVPNATGYAVYYTDGTTEWSYDPGLNTSMDLAVFNLTSGTYTFYVTAYNDNGESGPSNTVDTVKVKFVFVANPKPVPDPLVPVIIEIVE